MRRVGAIADERIQVRLLDGFGVTVDGCTVDLPLAAQRVVAFTALHHGPVLRSYVAGSLWKERPEQRATACLRSAVWRANRTCSLVMGGRTHVRLNDAAEIDAVETTSLANRLIRGADGSETTATDVGQLDRQLLPDWYEDWVVIERERLRQLCLNALERLSVSLREAGRTARAIDAALAVVLAEPLRESAHRILIEAHLAQGNRRQALQQYEELRELLDRELGLPPSPELRALMSNGGLRALAG